MQSAVAGATSSRPRRKVGLPVKDVQAGEIEERVHAHGHEKRTGALVGDIEADREHEQAGKGRGAGVKGREKQAGEKAGAERAKIALPHPVKKAAEKEF